MALTAIKKAAPASPIMQILTRQTARREEPEESEGQAALAPEPFSYVVEIADEAVLPFLATPPAPAAPAAPQAAPAEAKEPAAAKLAPNPRNQILPVLAGGLAEIHAPIEREKIMLIRGSPHVIAMLQAEAARLRAEAEDRASKATLRRCAGAGVVLCGLAVVGYAGCVGYAKTQEPETEAAKAFMAAMKKPVEVEVTAKLADGSEVALKDGAKVVLKSGAVVGLADGQQVTLAKGGTVGLDPAATVRAVGLPTPKPYPRRNRYAVRRAPLRPSSRLRLASSRPAPRANPERKSSCVL